jgi:RNA polymerase primary sigma factor
MESKFDRYMMDFGFYPTSDLIDENIYRYWFKIDVKEKISSILTEREKKVIELRFGLNGEKENTFEEIARMFGLSRERIRQIEAKAIRKIRGHIMKEDIMAKAMDREAYNES